MSEMSLNIGADLTESGSIVKPTDFFEPDSIEDGLLPEMNQDTDFVTMEALSSQISELESLRTRIARQGSMNRAFAMEALSIDEEVLNAPVNYYSENDSLVQYDQTMESLGSAIAQKATKAGAYAMEMIKKMIEFLKVKIKEFKLKSLTILKKYGFVAPPSINSVLVERVAAILENRPAFISQLQGSYVEFLRKNYTDSKEFGTIFKQLRNVRDEDAFEVGLAKLEVLADRMDQSSEVDKIDADPIDGAKSAIALLTNKPVGTRAIAYFAGFSSTEDLESVKVDDLPGSKQQTVRLSRTISSFTRLTSVILTQGYLLSKISELISKYSQQSTVTQEAYGAPLIMSMESFDAEEGLDVAQAQIDASQGVDAFNMGLGDQLDELQAMRDEVAVVPDQDDDQVLDDEGNPIDEEAYLLNTDNDIPEIDDVSMEADNEPVSKKGGLAAFANKAKNSAVEGMKRLIEMIKNFIAKVQDRFRKVTEPRAKKVKEMAKSLAHARSNARLQPLAKKFAELGNNNPVILQAFYDNGLIDAAHQQADQINQWFTQLSRGADNAGDPREVIKPVFVEQQDNAAEPKPADPAKMAEFVFDLISSDDTTMKVLQLVAKVNNLNDDVLPKLVQALERNHGEGASSMIAYAMKQVRTLTQNVDRLTNSIYDASNTATQALKGNSDENVSQEALDLKGMGQSIKQGASSAARHLVAMIKAMIEKFRQYFKGKGLDKAKAVADQAKELEQKRDEVKAQVSNPANTELEERLAAIGNGNNLIKILLREKGAIGQLHKAISDLDTYFKDMSKKLSNVKGSDNVSAIVVSVASIFSIPTVRELDEGSEVADFEVKQMADFVVELSSDKGFVEQVAKLNEQLDQINEGSLSEMAAQIERFEGSRNVVGKEGLQAYNLLTRNVIYLTEALSNAQNQLLGVIGQTKDQIAAENQAGDYSQESYLATYSQEGFGDKFRAGARRVLEMIKVLLAKLKKLWKAFSTRTMASTMNGLMKAKLLLDNDWSRSAVLYMQDKGVFEELVQMVNSKPYLVAISNDLSIINRVLIPATDAQIRMASNLNREIKALNKTLSNLSRNTDEQFDQSTVLGLAKVTPTNVGLTRAMDEYKALFNSTLDTPDQSIDGLVKSLDTIKKAVIDKRYLATYLNALDKLRDELASLPDIVVPSNLDESHPAMANVGEVISAIQRSLQEIEESLRIGYTTVHTGVEMIKRLNEALEVKEKIDLEVGRTA